MLTCLLLASLGEKDLTAGSGVSAGRSGSDRELVFCLSPGDLGLMHSWSEGLLTLGLLRPWHLFRSLPLDRHILCLGVQVLGDLGTPPSQHGEDSEEASG